MCMYNLYALYLFMYLKFLDVDCNKTSVRNIISFKQLSSEMGRNSFSEYKIQSLFLNSKLH